MLNVFFKLLSSDIETVRSTYVGKEASGAYKARQELLMRKQDYEAKMLACKTKEKDLRIRQMQVRVYLLFSFIGIF